MYRFYEFRKPWTTATPVCHVHALANWKCMYYLLWPLLPCEFWGYHNGVDEDEDILGCERHAAPSSLTDVSKDVTSPSSGSNSAKRISLTSIQNTILNAKILPVDLFLLWPQEWQKHVAGIPCLWCKVLFVYLCAFVYCVIVSNFSMHGHWLF